MLRLAITIFTLVSVAMPAFAVVNVYSYRQPELTQPLFSAFTKKTGIPVKSVFIDKGLLERLKAEGQRSPADLVMTTDISRLAALGLAGVTQPVEMPELSQAIPPAFRDPEGHWFGLTMRARIVYASRDRVAEGEISTYEDLADPKWKGRICTRSGTHPYNLALVAAMISHKGEEATREWLEGVKANLARRPQGNDRAQVKAIWAGECDIALGNTYYMGLMLASDEQRPWADAVRIDFPVFEGTGTHVNLSGMALTRAAPNRDEALALMSFLASPEAQAIYAETNHEYPLSNDAQVSQVVAGWGDLEPDGEPLSGIAELRPAALRLIEEVDFDG